MADDRETLVLPQDEFELVRALREKIEAALDASIDQCARCKVCGTQADAVMVVVGPALEHAASAAAGSHEGIRLWMSDCGELVAKHRARAEAAEAKLAAIRRRLRVEQGSWIRIPAILAIAGDGEGEVR